jgi:hypothetical protein
MGKPTAQEIKDLREQAAKDRAYNDAMPMPDTTFEEPVGRSKPGFKAEETNMPTKVQPSTTVNDVMKPRKPMKTGAVPFAKGGSVSSASKRADGIATKGKTRGTMIMCGGGKM